ncbi:MAG: DUF484 family protein [Magnetospirillum sp.]|nr:DUF484 family protein [Magnetospirillum sp.]
MARKTDDATLAVPLPREEQVVEYLRHHPDFLVRHPELLMTLAPPSRWTEAGGVVDMQVFLIERLREEVEDVKGAAEHLIRTSRSNMSTQGRTHQAVMALLGAETIDAIAEAVGDDLPNLLDVDIATLCLEESAHPVAELAATGIGRIPEGSVVKLLGGRNRECALFEEMPGDPMLFGDSSALVLSSAVVRLTPGGRCPEGLLALGSRHGRTFHPGQGTELLSFLARVIESCLRRFLA